MLLHLFHQTNNFVGFCDVGGNGDGFAGETLLLAEAVERVACFFAGVGFAGCYEDLGAAGLEEAVHRVELCVLTKYVT